MSNRALVVNASYEPRSVVAARRGTVLMLTGKADPVSVSGRLFHSEHLVVEVPSVVRLRHFVKVPFARRAALNRRAVFARDGGRCQHCGASADSIDHVVPRANGGPPTWENVVSSSPPSHRPTPAPLLHAQEMA